MECLGVLSDILCEAAEDGEELPLDGRGLLMMFLRDDLAHGDSCPLLAARVLWVAGRCDDVCVCGCLCGCVLVCECVCLLVCDRICTRKTQLHTIKTHTQSHAPLHIHTLSHTHTHTIIHVHPSTSIYVHTPPHIHTDCSLFSLSKPSPT